MAVAANLRTKHLCLSHETLCFRLIALMRRAQGAVIKRIERVGCRRHNLAIAPHPSVISVKETRLFPKTPPATPRRPQIGSLSGPRGLPQNGSAFENSFQTLVKPTRS